MSVFLALVLSGCGSGGGDTKAPATTPINPPVVNTAPVADAGPDQMVTSGATVTLAGTGTDADGTVASYAWTQDAGPDVGITGNMGSSPTFTAPTTTTDLVLAFRLTVTDYQGATGDDTVVVTVRGTGATDRTAQVSGRVTFDRVRFNSAPGTGLDLNHPVESPARGVIVHALNDASPPAVLAITQTDNNGNYRLNVPRNTRVRVQARAETVRTGTPAWDTRVIDNTDALSLYTLDGPVADVGTTDQVRNLRATTGWDGASYTGPRAAAPFAVLDTVYSAQQKVLAVDASARFPALTLNWSIKNIAAGDYPQAGYIGDTRYQFDSGQLYVLGKADVDTDEFDEHVILNAWGHYFAQSFSDLDGLEGPHAPGDRLDPREAFDEGFYDALAGMVTDNPLYRDSSGVGQARDVAIDLEANPTAADNSGWYSQASVRSILYDLYDSAADANDSTALGFGPLYQVLVGALKTVPERNSVFSFIIALKAANANAASAINTLVAAQRINAANIDNAGSTENNDAGGGANVLPLYTAITPNGAAQTVCTNNTFGYYNKLGNRRFLSFDLPQRADITVTATTTVSGSDPDILLHRRGEGTVTAYTSASQRETLSTSGRSPGRYVVEVVDRLNTYQEGGKGGRVCIRVAVATG